MVTAHHAVCGSQYLETGENFQKKIISTEKLRKLKYAHSIALATNECNREIILM